MATRTQAFPRIALPLAVAALWVAACGDDGEGTARPPNAVVRARIEALAPAAILGHRGTGVNRPDNPWPENSLPAFRQGIAEGADGIELDVELTADGRLVVMHDDTLDRTTDCTGCVNALTFEEVRSCALLRGDGTPTSERPPTLSEVFGVLPPDALVNVELKVFEPPCAKEQGEAETLVRGAVAEIRSLGAEERTLFSSFDMTAITLLKNESPDLYAALLTLVPEEETIAAAVEADLDAIHPFTFVPAETVGAILAAGMQVNIWTVNTEALMEESLGKGATAIITDEPDVLAALLGRPHPAAIAPP